MVPTWNEDNFTLTGMEIETLQDGGFHLRQQTIVDQLEFDFPVPTPFSSRH